MQHYSYFTLEKHKQCFSFVFCFRLCKPFAITFASEIAIIAKFDKKAKEALQTTHRESGTAVIREDDYTILVEFPKKVSWDQEGLKALYQNFNPKTRDKIIKTTLTVDEREYANFKENMKKVFDRYRTITNGKAKVSISNKGLTEGIETKEIA